MSTSRLKPERKRDCAAMKRIERVMDGCIDIKWCSVDSDGQMERKKRCERCDRWCMDGEKVITEEESVEVSRSRVSCLFDACKIEECL